MSERHRRVRVWRRMVVALGALALVAGAGACGGDDSTGGEKLGVAYLGPLTGDLANIGQAGRDAVQLAIDQANAAGDLPVRLALKVFDTQGDPAQAQRLTADVLADSSIVAVVGPLTSGEV